jgi:hypothetical protein
VTILAQRDAFLQFFRNAAWIALAAEVAAARLEAGHYRVCLGNVPSIGISAFY